LMFRAVSLVAMLKLVRSIFLIKKMTALKAKGYFVRGSNNTRKRRLRSSHFLVEEIFFGGSNKIYQKVFAGRFILKGKSFVVREIICNWGTLCGSDNRMESFLCLSFRVCAFARHDAFDLRQARH
jgi:hypothetical protein